tara:strand:- start:447 stop:1271 length:825 start_codon:yes stop_codon:yes gene_type:complete
VIEKYNIDYVVHGDDACLVDGKDVYAAAKAAGKYQSIPRTEGVSTTDIVGRMLLMTKDHHKGSSGEGNLASNNNMVIGAQSKFLTTSRMLRHFSASVKAPEDKMRIAYIDGGWDMFHAGHISILAKAKEMCDYLIVGIHSDTLINKHRGTNLPIMNLHERVLSVLGCKFVDDVLIDSPYVINKEMIASLKICAVFRGSSGQVSDEVELKTRFKDAMEAGIYRIVTSPSVFELSTIVERITENQTFFQTKIDKKKKKEDEYYDLKYSKTDHFKKK